MFRKSLSLSRAATRLTPRRASDPTDEFELQDYAGFIDAVGHGVGELTPLAGEDAGEVAAALDRAAAYLGIEARVWIDAGRVYFFVRRDRDGGW
jgi:hypothetical protein